MYQFINEISLGKYHENIFTCTKYTFFTSNSVLRTEILYLTKMFWKYQKCREIYETFRKITHIRSAESLFRNLAKMLFTLGRTFWSETILGK